MKSELIAPASVALQAAGPAGPLITGATLLHAMSFLLFLAMLAMGLLSADNISRLFDLAKGHADLVVFDSAPVLAVADNLALASMVDAVILVVRAGVTQRRDLVRAKAMLDKVRAPVVGAVLNRVSSRETRRYYRSYSGYYGVGEGTSVRRRFTLSAASFSSI